MDDKRLHEQVTRAVQGHCAHLRPNPYLAQKVLRAAKEKETPRMKKFSIGLIFTLILMMLTATAVAVALLTGMEVIEQTAVPLAQQNDQNSVRPNDSYSAEELQSLIRVAAENGIILDDDTSVMRALRSGEGYYEEEAIMAICREAFGGLYNDWTIEQRHWFSEIMVAIGWSTENSIPLPGEGDLTSDAARQLARDTVYKHFGQDIPLTDPTQYRMQEEFYGDEFNNTANGADWVFRFVPQNIRGTTYYITMDAGGQWVEHSAETPDWSTYTETRLANALTKLYATTGTMLYMEQEGWVELCQMLPGAAHSEYWSTDWDAYAMTTYVPVAEDDLTKSAVRAMLLERLDEKENANFQGGVLVEIDGMHVWRMTLTITENPADLFATPSRYIFYEVNAKTGEILSEVEEAYARPVWASCVPERVYQELKGDAISPEEAIEAAVAFLHGHYGDETIPFRDEAVYDIGCAETANGKRYRVSFTPLQLGYARAAVYVSGSTGEVTLNFAKEMGLTIDTLFTSYTTVYGTDMDWTPAQYAAYSQHLATLEGEATTFDGKLYQQTTYLDDSSVAITKDEACDIAVLDNGDKTVNIIRCMLIDAEPNPIWKIRLGSYPANLLYEIDAMTGEVLDKEWYIIQDPSIDHDMKMYTLRSVFMPAYLSLYGVERVAMEYAVKSDMGRYAWEGHEQFLTAERYYVVVDGLTVTFAGLTEEDTSYRVTVSKDGMSAEVMVLDDVTELLKTAPESTTAWSVGHYGLDRTRWPEGYQGGDQPNPGEMSRDEAIAHARELLLKQVTQEQYDALGEVHVRATMHRFTNGGECVSWSVDFVSQASWDDDDPRLEGWNVQFSMRDGEFWCEPQVKDVNDPSNG